MVKFNYNIVYAICLIYIVYLIITICKISSESIENSDNKEPKKEKTKKSDNKWQGLKDEYLIFTYYQDTRYNFALDRCFTKYINNRLEGKSLDDSYQKYFKEVETIADKKNNNLQGDNAPCKSWKDIFDKYESLVSHNFFYDGDRVEVLKFIESYMDNILKEKSKIGDIKFEYDDNGKVLSCSYIWNKDNKENAGKPIEK